MSSKAKIEFEGFDEVLNRLSKLNGDTFKTTEKALKDSQKHINEKLHKEMKKHKLTGATEKSIVEEQKVRWFGTEAEIDIGFDISEGGLASIFLMYGTKGTPRHAPTKQDKKLFSALYGSETRKEIQKIQEDIFYEEIRRLDK